MPRREPHPPIRVVRHGRARRMTLRVSCGGVRLTVPPGASARRIDAFLRESSDWIAERAALLGPPPAPLAPGERLALLDGGLTLALGAPAGGATARRDGDLLRVRPAPGGDLDAAVERWYRREAARVLEERSRAVAAGLGAEVAAVAVRDPRSRWGSCSSSGRLSFSWRLLLAPEAVLDYVVAHEVCHLVRPDHSRAYWDLVGRVSPGFERPRAWLRDRGEALHLGPAWRSRGGEGALSPA
jgi:predicted metal-dependent hydrolase